MPGSSRSNHSGSESPGRRCRIGGRRERMSMQLGETRAVAGALAHQQTLRPVWRTFRNILVVVFLIFAFAIVQMVMLWRVCNTGTQTGASLEQHGLPTLNELALLQENLATFRLNSYEYLFARE